MIDQQPAGNPNPDEVAKSLVIRGLDNEGPFVQLFDGGPKWRPDPHEGRVAAAPQGSSFIQIDGRRFRPPVKKCCKVNGVGGCGRDNKGL